MCYGVWLERGDWAVVRGLGVHAALPRLLVAAWHAVHRTRMDPRAAEARLARLLSPDEFDRARSLRAWVQAHPCRSELLVYLSIEEPGGPNQP
jgi:hypothetical protein